MAKKTSQVAPPSAASFAGWEEHSQEDLAAKTFSNRVFQDVEDGDYEARMTIKVSDTSKKNPKTPSTIVTVSYQLVDDPGQRHDAKFWFNHPKSDNYDVEKAAKTTKRLIQVLQTVGVNTNVKGKTPMACIKEAAGMCNPFLTVGINVKNPENQTEEQAEKYGPWVNLNEVLPSEVFHDDAEFVEEVAGDDSEYEADSEAPFDDDENLEDYEEDMDDDGEVEEQEAPPARRPKTPSTPPSRRR